MSNHHFYSLGFSLNGSAIDIEVRATQTLLTLLRDDLHQWDVKLRCGKGDSGSCQEKLTKLSLTGSLI